MKKLFLFFLAGTVGHLSLRAQLSTNAPLLPPSVAVNLSTNAPRYNNFTWDTQRIYVTGAGTAAANGLYTNLHVPGTLVYQSVINGNYNIRTLGSGSGQFWELYSVSGLLYTNPAPLSLFRKWGTFTNTAATNPAPTVTYGTNSTRYSTNAPVTR